MTERRSTAQVNRICPLDVRPSHRHVTVYD
jgi:hypothetical protein